VLLHRRGWTVHYPRTWGPPGGARDSHESEVHAALREAAEEIAVPEGVVRPTGIHLDDHGGWAYRTVLAEADEPFGVRNANRESIAAGWIPAPDVAGLELHPGFAAAWPRLSAVLEPATVIVDTANVMGSRADGWWRDRAGAAARLHGEVAALAARGVPGEGDGDLERRFPGYLMVLEGAARAALGRLPAGLAQDGNSPPPAGAVAVAAAGGSGDDLIARLAADLPGRRLVITADRELRGRVQAAGAAVTGPRWLLGQLAAG
jgi:ADP-ribose pyrophosphatase YjhB (NUDIX family)